MSTEQDLSLGELLQRVRDTKPLVHNITNYVVMNFTANVLLALGASPVMAHSQEEVEDMVAIARTLVINIGTLSPPWVKAMELAGNRANTLKVPVILDPVGSGATKYRTETTKQLIQKIEFSVIRGNASEILSIQEEKIKTKGVDSIHTSLDAIDYAIYLANKLKTVIAITGKVDIVTDGKNTYKIFNGHPLLSYVTGTGCAATVSIAAFLACESNPLLATVAGLCFFGLAGELASEKAENPGLYRVKLIDALFEISPDYFEKSAKYEKI